MKKIIVILLFTTVVVSAQAQLFRIGVKGGINVQTSDIKSTQELKQLYESKNRYGWHLGLQSSIKVLPFLAIQPDILYTRSSFDFSSASSQSYKVRCNTIDVPVLASLRLLGPVHIQVGPSFNLMNKSSLKNYDIFMSRPSMSYLAGVTVDLGKVNMSLRYNGQFKKLRHDISSEVMSNQVFKTSASNFQLSIGMFF